MNKRKIMLPATLIMTTLGIFLLASQNTLSLNLKPTVKQPSTEITEITLSASTTPPTQNLAPSISAETPQKIWRREQAIYLTNLEATSVKKLLSGNYWYPVFTTDEEYLMLEEKIDKQHSRLIRFNLKTHAKSYLGDFKTITGLYISPEREILSIVTTDDIGSQIYLYDLSAETIQKVFETSLGYVKTVSWSFDSHLLAFDHCVDEQFRTLCQILLLDIETNIAIPVTINLSGSNFSPVFSPTDYRLSFLSTEDGFERTISFADISQTPALIEKTTIIVNFSPAFWSPDGRYVLADGAMSVTLVETENQTKTTLFIWRVGGYYLEHWLPNGKMLFEAGCCDSSYLAVYDTKLSKLYSLHMSEHIKFYRQFQADISPISHQVVFVGWSEPEK